MGRSAPDKEGHRDASDDDYTDGEECYGDEYCVCGCNDKDDASCPSEEEEVAEPKEATEENDEKFLAAISESMGQRKAATRIQQAWRKHQAR